MIIWYFFRDGDSWGNTGQGGPQILELRGLGLVTKVPGRGWGCGEIASEELRPSRSSCQVYLLALSTRVTQRGHPFFSELSKCQGSSCREEEGSPSDGWLELFPSLASRSWNGIKSIDKT